MSPPAPVVEAALDAELGEDDSSALEVPPLPSSVPAAQLIGEVARSAAPAVTRVREATRRPTRARPDAKKDRGDMPRTSITRPARAATFAGFWRNLPGIGVAFRRASPESSRSRRRREAEMPVRIDRRASYTAFTAAALGAVVGVDGRAGPRAAGAADADTAAARRGHHRASAREASGPGRRSQAATAGGRASQGRPSQGRARGRGEADARARSAEAAAPERVRLRVVRQDDRRDRLQGVLPAATRTSSPTGRASTSPTTSSSSCDGTITGRRPTAPRASSPPSPSPTPSSTTTGISTSRWRSATSTSRSGISA